MPVRHFFALLNVCALALFYPGCASMPTVRLRTVTITSGVIVGVEKNESVSMAESVGLGFEINPPPR